MTRTPTSPAQGQRCVLEACLEGWQPVAYHCCYRSAPTSARFSQTESRKRLEASAESVLKCQFMVEYGKWPIFNA